MSDGELGDKLRIYFRDLAPEARLMLATGLAGAGGALPHADLILGALKGAMRDNGEIIPLEDMAFVVFQPCATFTTASETGGKAPGIILKASLERVWRWLEDGAASQAIARFRKTVEADPLGRASPEALNTLRAACGKAIADTVRTVEENGGPRKLAVQLGHERAADDLQDISAALRYEKVLNAFAADLDGDLKLPPDDALAAVKQHLAVVVKKAKPATALAVSLLKARLGAPGLVTRFLVGMAGTSKVEHLLESPYSALIDLVLLDAERAVAEAQSLRGAANTAGLVAAIKIFGATMRAINSDLEFDSRSPLAKRIIGFRKSMSEALAGRMTDLTQRVKQLVRPRADAKGGALALDAAEVERLDGDIAVLMAARHYADDLALKADTSRVYSGIKDLLDTSMPLLIDRLRALPMDGRDDMRNRLEAVARISKRLFGEEYAGLLLKAVQVADAPAPVRKAATV